MSDLDVGTIVVVVLVLLVLGGWYLSYSAARLDRLHAKVEGAVSALDAQLVRRAEASLELAETEHPLRDDPLDGQHFAGRESVESDLTWALEAALPEQTVTLLREGDSDAAAALARVEAAALRVQLARRFLNDAVAEVRRVRAKWVVRAFRLAGYAGLPEPVILDDDLPSSLRS
jgi:hypothetical protein